MFKPLDNNISIPNNYVYTSHKGTEYMYLEGSWMNCETMSTVASTHNFKMNQSAIKQIAEHNSTNVMQIGKKYLIKESEYVYVGRNNFTLNGNMLAESINSRVLSLMEADAAKDKKSKIKDFTPGNPESTDIPERFKLDDYTYDGKKKSWWGPTGNGNKGYITDQSEIDSLNNDARDLIKKYNSKDPYPVNSTLSYNGKTAIWNGDKWIVQGEGAFPDGFTHEVNDYYHDVYLANGGNNSQSEDESNNSSANEDRYDDKSSSDISNSITVIPNGYVYTSGKGKSYLKKNGQWFSTETKKPINSSSSIPLERAAKAAIDKHNANASVKIGDEFTSRKGIKYKYVGGTRFISDNGKLLPKDTAQTVLDKLWKEADDRKAQEEKDTVSNNNSGDSVLDNSNDASGENKPETKTDAPEDTTDNDGLKELANQVKSSPEARRIIVLLSRGDEISLLAADILLSGKQSEVSQILKSLNNEE